MPVKMFRWYVRIVCFDYSFDQTLLAFLATCLKEPSCTILENECRYYLVSSEFETLTDGLDVLECARKYIPILNSIVKLKFAAHVPDINRYRIRCEEVYQPNKAGHLIKYRYSRFFDQEEEFVLTKKFLRTFNTLHPSLSELWLAVKNHPELEEAIDYYENGYGWAEMYKVYEVIKGDVRKLEKSGSISKETLNTWTQGRARDFEQSAHNAYISGSSARHSYAGSSSKVKGVNPMSSSEASEFITHLLQEWVKIKV